MQMLLGAKETLSRLRPAVLVEAVDSYLSRAGDSRAALWQFIRPIPGPVHITLGAEVRRKPRPGLQIHRSRTLTPSHITRRHAGELTAKTLCRVVCQILVARVRFARCRRRVLSAPVLFAGFMHRPQHRWPCRMTSRRATRRRRRLRRPRPRRRPGRSGICCSRRASGRLASALPKFANASG